MADFTPIDAVAVIVVMRNAKTGEVSTLTLNEPTSASIDIETFEKEEDFFSLTSMKQPDGQKITLKAEISTKAPEFNKRVSEDMMTGQSQVLGKSWVNVLNVTHTRVTDLVERVAKAAKVYRGG